MARYTARKNSYLEYYKDPRWQKKRLEVMERDDFSCCACGESEKTLNVHHCYYKDGYMPWEYDSSSLVTLCEDCHSFQKEEIEKHKKFLIMIIASNGAHACQVEEGLEHLYYGMKFYSDYIHLSKILDKAKEISEKDKARTNCSSGRDRYSKVFGFDYLDIILEALYDYDVKWSKKDNNG